MKNITTETARLHPGQNYAGHSSAEIQASHADDLGGSTPSVFTLAPRLPHHSVRVAPVRKALRAFLAMTASERQPVIPPPALPQPRPITPPEPPVLPMEIDGLDLI